MLVIVPTMERQLPVKLISFNRERERFKIDENFDFTIQGQKSPRAKN